MELKDKIGHRLEQLQNELNDLIKHRDFIAQQKQQIEIRLAQIVGAMSEFKLLQEEPVNNQVACDCDNGECQGCDKKIDEPSKEEAPF